MPVRSSSTWTCNGPSPPDPLSGPIFTVGRGPPCPFRYGVYGTDGPIIVGSTGIYSYALQLNGGRLVADVRSVGAPPSYDGVMAPIAAQLSQNQLVTVGQPWHVGSTIVIPLSLIHETARARIYLGVVPSTLETVVLKVGYSGVGGNRQGRDVGIAFKAEFDLLTQLKGTEGITPTALACCADPCPCLLIEDFRGTALSDLPRTERIAALPALAAAVALVHDQGVMHGDVKLENAVWRSGSVGLLDFELAASFGELTGQGRDFGAFGPEVRGRPLAAAARDVFALAGSVAQAYLDISPGLLPIGSGSLRGSCRSRARARRPISSACSRTMTPLADPPRVPRRQCSVSGCKWRRCFSLRAVLRLPPLNSTGVAALPRAQRPWSHPQPGNNHSAAIGAITTSCPRSIAKPLTWVPPASCSGSLASTPLSAAAACVHRFKAGPIGWQAKTRWGRRPACSPAIPA